LEAYDHQDMPFERLVQALEMPRDLSRSPVFQVMLILQQAPFRPEPLPGLELHALPWTETTAKFDLTLELIAADAGSLQGKFEYNTDLFESGTIEGMIRAFRAALKAMSANSAAHLDQLDLTDPRERETALVDWNATAKPLADPAPVFEIFARRAAETPDAIAVRCRDRALTYAQLNARANQLAHLLIARGLRREEPVGLCVHRSIEMVVGLLGVIKAGGAYTPMDPDYPLERLAYMAESAGMRWILSAADVEARPSGEGLETIWLDRAETLEAR
jgi:non-ribosomal peptide synthetase component F